MKRFCFLATLTFCAAITSGFPSWADDSELLPAELLQISSTEAFSKYVFLVDKKDRKLIVFERSGETIRKIDEVPADIGKNDGNKTRKDDHKTPEGIYFFQEKLGNPEIPFSLYGKMAFTTDYPNLFDRRVQKTGSGIWLHSIPDEVPLTRGSRGCVVIRNNVLEKISSYIKLRETPIIIYDKLEYISKEEHARRRETMKDFLESWKKSWESMDIDKYLSFYDPSFSAPGFQSFNSWKNHKTKLKNRREFIRVTLSQPFMLMHRDQLIVKTLQKYESSEHADYGVKTIYAQKTGEKYRIIREEWIPANESGELLNAVQAQATELGKPTVKN
jgi:murein L,D-transpeptidase YafK